jgi:muconolactone delta-isomerase
MVMMAENPEDVHAKLSILPYYPYMKIDIVPVRVDNAIAHYYNSKGKSITFR